jgi:hypothetical protein
MSTEEIRTRKGRRPKARATAIIVGALEENARMLLNDPKSGSIGARIAELLEELGRSLNGRDNETEPEP